MIVTLNVHSRCRFYDVHVCLHCRTSAILSKMFLNYNKQEPPLKGKNQHTFSFMCFTYEYMCCKITAELGIYLYSCCKGHLSSQLEHTIFGHPKTISAIKMQLGTIDYVGVGNSQPTFGHHRVTGGFCPYR